MNILLINPSNVGELQTFRFGVGHLGLAYIASVLESSGYDCSVIDAKYHKLSPRDVCKKAIDSGSNIFGITAMTHEIHSAHEIAKGIKKGLPDSVIVVGGPHSTALPERTLNEFPSFDIAVFGEGEKTMLDIVKHYDNKLNYENLKQINGCAFRHDNQIFVNNPRQFMSSAEIDSLPNPAWHLFPDQSFPQFAGRGCPYRCAFCMRVLGSKIRMRSPESVVNEIQYLHDSFNKNGSWFQDETFGLNKKWTINFLELLEEFRNSRKVNWTWKANSRVNIADYDIYKRMKELGCKELDFGVESGNIEILRATQKDITPDQAVEAIKIAQKAGLRANAFFIIGHPNETFKTAIDTIRLAARLNATGIAVGVMVPYPGTKIWEMAQNNENGYRLLSEDWRLYDKYFGDALEINNLSKDQLKILQSLCYLWFYLRNLRFKELFNFIRSHAKESLHMLKLLTESRHNAQPL